MADDAPVIRPLVTNHRLGAVDFPVYGFTLSNPDDVRLDLTMGGLRVVPALTEAYRTYRG